MVVILAVTASIFIYGIVKGEPLVQLFLNTSVALAVAAIPEGLLVGTDSNFGSVGMNRILKRKAVVRGLIAAETLGSVSTICLDKTGTITLGKMVGWRGRLRLWAILTNKLKTKSGHDKKK